MAKITITNDDLGVKKLKILKTKTVDDRNGDRVLVISGRLYRNAQGRCPICGKKCAGYDTRKSRRVYRTLDVLDMPAYIVMDAVRIRCPEHGVLSEDVPFAVKGSHFTRDFELMVTWLARRADKTTVSVMMRISWNTVGSIIKRTKDYLEPDPSARFNGLIDIGIDETSYRKGHKYITTVVNLRTNTVVWVGINHGKKVLSAFFELLTEEQRKSIQTISGDGARWIDECREKYIPHATRGLDPFHCVEWAQESLDEIRRQAWRRASAQLKEEMDSQPKKGRGRPGKGEENESLKEKKEAVKSIKNSRYALGKNPENLTADQQAKLEIISVTDRKLTRAYQLKESLRAIFHLEDRSECEERLSRWLSWAQRCRIPEFVELGRKIKRHKEAILATVDRGLSSSKVEALNNKIKVIIRRSYGFRNTDNLKAMVLLCCSDIKIPLPNRNNHAEKGRKALPYSMLII